MHSRKKGKSGSKHPVAEVSPSWLQYSKEEVVELVLQMAKEGKTVQEMLAVLDIRRLVATFIFAIVVSVILVWHGLPITQMQIELVWGANVMGLYILNRFVDFVWEWKYGKKFMAKVVEVFNPPVTP